MLLGTIVYYLEVDWVDVAIVSEEVERRFAGCRMPGAAPQIECGPSAML